MNHIQHIFWDLDRTLWDFETNSTQTLNELYDQFQLASTLKISAPEFIAKYKSVNEMCWGLYRRGEMTKERLRSKRFGDTLAHFGCTDALLAQDVGEAYLQQSPIKSNLFEGAYEVLQALQSKYRMHIITNGFEEVQHIKLKNSDLLQYFDAIVTSEQTGHKKPDSRVFEYALRKAKADATQSLMIGDSYFVDCVGGYRIGMTSVWFNPHQEIVEEPVEEIFEIQQLKQLLDLLRV